VKDTAAAEVAAVMVAPGVAAAVMLEVETLLKLAPSVLPDASPKPRPRVNETAD
jgi:hypothetical protein